MIHGPLRGTNDMLNSLLIAGSAYFRLELSAGLPLPMDTIRQDCLRAAEDTGWTLLPSSFFLSYTDYIVSVWSHTE